MNRPGHDEYFMDIARLAAARSNCYRRKVGCVLVDSHNRILSTGYNGVPRGFPHCKPGTCPRENQDSGTNLQLCLGVHSEINAIIQCRDTDKIHKAYITDSPCLQCTLALMNTFCQEIIFDRKYPDDGTPQRIWTEHGRWWKQYE